MQWCYDRRNVEPNRLHFLGLRSLQHTSRCSKIFQRLWNVDWSKHWYKYGNRQSQGPTNWFACDVTNKNKISKTRYNYIKSYLLFMLKSKRLPFSNHSTEVVVYGSFKIYSESNETVSFWWHMNFMKLSAESALYHRLIVDLYSHINGSKCGGLLSGIDNQYTAHAAHPVGVQAVGYYLN